MLFLPYYGEILKKKKAAEEAKIIDAAKKIADKISNLSLTIAAQAGEEEKLFGSISNEDIAAALGLENIKIDKRDIVLEEPIKKLGTYQAIVKLHPEVKANLKILIVKK